MPSMSPTLPRRALLPLMLGMALTAPPLPATTLEGDRLLLSLSGSGTFGWEVDALADIDGDGVDEIIVPSPFLDANRGLVEVFSGADGRVLLRFPGPAAGALFGVGIEDAGDVDRDGVNDVLIGAAGMGDGGEAQVVSGRDGRQLLRILGDAGMGLGGRVASAGDIDGDGHGDVWVAGSGLPGSGFAGSVWLVSGRTGARLQRIDAPTGASRFGAGLSAVGDMDGDRLGDVLIGAPGTAPGSAYVVSSRSGAVLRTLPSPDGGTAFGQFFVSDPGDVDGDDHDDLYVGDFAAGGGSGRAMVFSGLDGRTLLRLEGQAGEGLGTGRGVPRLDALGRGGLVLGHYLSSAGGQRAGRVSLRRSPDGATAQVLTNRESNQQFGYDAGLLGDVDGDGSQDLLVSLANDNRVEVLAGKLAEGAALQAPNRGHTGLWFDPAHAGEGFVVEALVDGRFAVYWFTYAGDGSPRYFVAIAEAVGRRLLARPLLVSRGGRFGSAFAEADVVLEEQARLVLSFDGCGSGWAEYTVDGSRGRQRLQRLSALPGQDCTGAPASAGARWSGSWFAPGAAGEGWILQASAADRYQLLWFSYTATGSQQWFIANGGRSEDNTLRFDDVRHASGGRFGRYFDPSDVSLAPWGDITFRFTGCGVADVSWRGRDGEGCNRLQRLTVLDGVPCEG